MPALRDMLEASDALEKRASRALDASTRDDLLSRKALVDVAAFGLFKQSAWTQQLHKAVPGLMKGLGWGVGLGVPALAAGHMLLSDAKNQAKDVVHDARNQVLLGGMGLGGMQALGQGLGRLVPHRMEASTEQTYPGGDVFSAFHQAKMSSDQAFIEKLAAIVLLDDFLEARVNETRDKTAAECLVLNRELGAALLREVLL